MNTVQLVGRLTKEVDLKFTSSGTAVGSFTIAVNRSFTNQQGQREADFINCVVWRIQADNLVKYIKKGGLIGIEGEIQTRTYDDKNGTKKYITEVLCNSIEFLESKSQQSKSNYDPFEEIAKGNNTVENATIDPLNFI